MTYGCEKCWTEVQRQRPEVEKYICTNCGSEFRFEFGRVPVVVKNGKK